MKCKNSNSHEMLKNSKGKRIMSGISHAEHVYKYTYIFSFLFSAFAEVFPQWLCTQPTLKITVISCVSSSIFQHMEGNSRSTKRAPPLRLNRSVYTDPHALKILLPHLSDSALDSVSATPIN